MSNKCQNCYSLTRSYQRATVTLIIHADLSTDEFQELMNDRAAARWLDGMTEAPVRSDLHLSSGKRVSELDLEHADTRDETWITTEESQQLHQQSSKVKY